MDMLTSANSGPRRVGKKELIKHLTGVRLTQRQAIKAKCFDCDGMGDTGECSISTCALFPYSSYKQENVVKEVV